MKEMEKTKKRKERGITLIALVITIVLLILAGVSIAMLTGENGILTQAQNAKKATERASIIEQVQLDILEKQTVNGSGDITAGELEEILKKYFSNEEENLKNIISGTTSEGEETKLISKEDETIKIDLSEIYNGDITDETTPPTPTGSTLEQADGTQENNIVVQDKLGNKIKVPKGFKIVNTTDNVEAGIIIEDVSAKDATTKGSQFVWIPVGTVHREGKEDVEIDLNRYTFAETTGNETAMEDAEIDEYNGDPCQELASSTYGNTPALEIGTFLTKVEEGEAKGFYIGRYEARDGITKESRNSSTDDTNQVVTKADKFVYNYVTQSQAATLSQNMYGKTGDFTSDLINSYAWDTALVFIQKCSDDSRYSQQNSLNTGSLAEKGTTNDVKCNIYDMASNCAEWSTETAKNEEYPCVSRGGDYGYSVNFAGARYGNDTGHSNDGYSFRPLLYL